MNRLYVLLKSRCGCIRELFDKIKSVRKAAPRTNIVTLHLGNFKNDDAVI